MSLINDMLRDLEARRAGELRQNNLQQEIRPLPERRRSSPRGLYLALAGLSLAAVAGGGAWWYLGAQRVVANQPAAEPMVQQPAPTAQLAATPVAPAPTAQTPAQPPAVQAHPMPIALPSPVQPAVVQALTPVQALPSASAKSKAPAPAAIETASVQPAKTAPSRQQMNKAPAAVAPSDPVAAKPAPVPAVSQGAIEKTAALGTPRERAEAEFRRAQTLLANGQAAAALESLQGALKQDATHNPARQLLVKTLLESRRQDEAMAALQEGLEQQPAQIGWAMSLARLTMERGDVAGAEQVLARSGSYGRNSDSFAGFHGHLLNRLGQFREAAEQYQVAARIAPADGRWWFGLGQALEGDGRAQEARSAFRRALDSGNLNAELKILAEQKSR